MLSAVLVQAYVLLVLLTLSDQKKRKQFLISELLIFLLFYSQQPERFTNELQSVHSGTVGSDSCVPTDMQSREQ